MQTETILLTKKFKLEFEKFDDWVYIKCSNHEAPYLLPRKYFDEIEAKHAKYNWLLNIEHADMYHALSEEYLKQYFETGSWTPMDNTWIVNPLPLLKAGVKNRYFVARPFINGFLYFNNKPIRKAISINFHGYHSEQEVIKSLQKNPKVLSAKFVDDGYYDNDTYISVTYLPSVKEFNKFIADADDDINICDIDYKIIQRLTPCIKNFKKVDY